MVILRNDGIRILILGALLAMNSCARDADEVALQLGAEDHNSGSGWFDCPTRELGEASNADTIHVKFPFKAPERTASEITAVQLSCGCQSAKIFLEDDHVYNLRHLTQPIVLCAGQSGHIEMTVDPKGRTGVSEFYARLVTSDAAASVQYLILRVDLKSDLLFTPYHVDVGDIRAGMWVPWSFMVSRRDGGDWTPPRIENSGAQLSELRVRTAPFEGEIAQCYQVSGRLMVRESGPCVIRIGVHSGTPGSSGEILIMGYARPTAWVEPRVCSLARFDSAKGVKCVVHLRISADSEKLCPTSVTVVESSIPREGIELALVPCECIPVADASNPAFTDRRSNGRVHTVVHHAFCKSAQGATPRGVMTASG